MSQNKSQSISIIGAGLAGCFLAILLAIRGYKIEIFERSSAEEIADKSSKRSFNLTFYDFGNLLGEAKHAYKTEMGKEAWYIRPVSHMNLRQNQEYCQIYANRFAEWKKERERNPQ